MEPEAKSEAGERYGKPHFAAGQRLFALLIAGLAFIPLMFISRRLGWGLLVWDIAVALMYLVDLRRLPPPRDLVLARSFEHSLELLRPSQVILKLTNESAWALHCEITDSVPESLSLIPPQMQGTIPARGSTTWKYEVVPAKRGDFKFSKAFARCETRFRIAQVWIAFPIEQPVRVYPALRESRQQQAMLMRSRQIELQRRTMRQRGQGREFESLREFQSGDELRDICWTATARRSKLVTTLRQSERSQAIWALIDCGRLMRARLEGRSKLDYAAETAIRLAQLANHGGDTSGLLAYGRSVQQRRVPGRGFQHLHAMLDQLAMIEEESSEADHLHAAGALMTIQKRRAMIVWITDLADMAITPEVVTAALHAGKRHLVTVAVLGQPDVAKLASTAPSTAEQTFLYAAASETIRRRELTMAALRGRGVHVIEVNAPSLVGAVLNRYLEVKQKNLL